MAETRTRKERKAPEFQYESTSGEDDSSDASYQTTSSTYNSSDSSYDSDDALERFLSVDYESDSAEMLQEMVMKQDRLRQQEKKARAQQVNIKEHVRRRLNFDEESDNEAERPSKKSKTEC